MNTIRLLNRKTKQIGDYDLYIGNISQTIYVGLPDGEHRGYNDLSALAEDYKILTSNPLPPTSEQVKEIIDKENE